MIKKMSLQYDKSYERIYARRCSIQIIVYRFLYVKPPKKIVDSLSSRFFCVGCIDENGMVCICFLFSFFDKRQCI